MDECEERIIAIPNSRLAQMLRSNSEKPKNYSNSDVTNDRDTYASEDGMETVTSLASVRLDEFNQVN